MDDLDGGRAGDPRLASDLTAEHAFGFDRARTATMQLAPRTRSSPAPASVQPPEQSSGAVLLGLAAFAGIVAFVLGGLIAAGAGDAEPPEPLTTPPIEASVVPPTVATVPATTPPRARPVPVGDLDREDDDKRGRQDDERDKGRDDRGKGRDD